HLRGADRVAAGRQVEPEVVGAGGVDAGPGRVEQDDRAGHPPLRLGLPVGRVQRRADAGQQVGLRVGGEPPDQRAVFGQVGGGGGLVAQDEGGGVPDGEESDGAVHLAGPVVVRGRLLTVGARPERQHRLRYRDERTAARFHPLCRARLRVTHHAPNLQSPTPADGTGVQWPVRCRSTDPERSLTTSSWAWMRRRRSATWLTMPTLRSRSRSESRTSRTSSRVWSSRLPKPSSMNRVSSRTPPASSVTTSARPRARASEAKNVSPPDRVAVSRSRPVQASTTCRPRPLRPRPARSSEWTRV